MKTPFVYFGNKSRIAQEVWSRLGDPAYFFEPFAGALGILLNRPAVGQYEFVGDADCLITNFWRASRLAPKEVAKHADWPASSLDLEARTAFLKRNKKRLLKNLRTNPEFFDPKMAGWYAWVQSTRIGPLGASVSVGRVAGVHRERRSDSLVAYFEALAQRLSKVQIIYGDWTRLTYAAMRSARNGAKCAVFLDPPYTSKSGRCKGLYAVDNGDVGTYVQRWAVAAASKNLRVVICGYAGEYTMPSSWEEVRWNSNYGKGRERIWFSPS